MGFEERVHEMDQEHRELRRNLNEARDNENDAIRKSRNAEDDLRRMKKRLEETEDELNEKLRKKEHRYDQVQEENTELIGHHNKSQMTVMALRNELEGAAERERDWRQKCRSLQEDLNRTKFALSIAESDKSLYMKGPTTLAEGRHSRDSGSIDVEAFCHDFDVRLTKSKRGNHAYVNDLDYRGSQDLRVSQGYGRRKPANYSNYRNGSTITPIRRHGHDKRSVRFSQDQFEDEKGALRQSTLYDEGQKISALGHVGTIDYSPTEERRSVREEVESFVYD